MAAIDRDLRAAAVGGRAERERRYLKSDLEHYGTPVPAVRAAVRAHVGRRSAPSHDRVVAVASGLWSRPVHERRLAAAMVLADHTDALGPDDAALVEDLLRRSRTWALVDVLAPSVMGPLVAEHPEVGPVLDRWVDDTDPWLRRAAVLALLRPLRAGGGDWDRFARYADRLLADREFFVAKALGWVLRDTARRRPELVYDWLLPRAAEASAVTVREAVKPLDDRQRAAIAAARARPAGGPPTP